MFLKKQDLGRQGRGCPETELGTVFKMGHGGKQATQESLPTAGRGIALVSKLLSSRGWVDTCMHAELGRQLRGVGSLPPFLSVFWGLNCRLIPDDEPHHHPKS